jgi:hypothetical protein
MKKLYGRHLEISTNGKDWEFVKFFKNDMCYMEEVPDFQEVWKADTYENAIELLSGWRLHYMEIKIPIIKKRFVSIAIPFSGNIIMSEKNTELYIRVKYDDKSQATMEELMKRLSNQHFIEWAKDNELNFLEKRA